MARVLESKFIQSSELTRFRLNGHKLAGPVATKKARFEEFFVLPFGYSMPCGSLPFSVGTLGFRGVCGLLEGTSGNRPELVRDRLYLEGMPPALDGSGEYREG
jgi:hypothetical protein